MPHYRSNMRSKFCAAICFAVSTTATPAFAQEMQIILITPDSNKTELRPNYDNIIQISPLPRRAKFSIDGSQPSPTIPLQTLGGDKYIYRVGPSMNYRRVTFQVWHEGEILTSKTFSIIVEGPEVQLAGVRYDTISSQAIRNNPVVEVFHNGHTCTVLRFQFHAAPKRGEFFGPFQIEGSRINHPDVIAFFSRNMKGDRIFLSHVETQCADGINSHALPKLEAIFRVVR